MKCFPLLDDTHTNTNTHTRIKTCFCRAHRRIFKHTCAQSHLYPPTCYCTSSPLDPLSTTHLYISVHSSFLYWECDFYTSITNTQRGDLGGNLVFIMTTGSMCERAEPLWTNNGSVGWSVPRWLTLYIKLLYLPTGWGESCSLSSESVCSQLHVPEALFGLNPHIWIKNRCECNFSLFAVGSTNTPSQQCQYSFKWLAQTVNCHIIMLYSCSALTCWLTVA